MSISNDNSTIFSLESSLLKIKSLQCLGYEGSCSESVVFPNTRCTQCNTWFEKANECKRLIEHEEKLFNICLKRKIEAGRFVGEILEARKKRKLMEKEARDAEVWLKGIIEDRTYL